MVLLVSDWIDQFYAYTEGIPSPEIFRLWAGISAVAGALERRVWVQTSGGILYPNLFTLLVAPPAIGKSQAINQARSLWMDTKKLKVAPNSISKAGLLDALVRSSNAIPLQGEGLFQYAALNVASSEFGVLVPAHDTEFLSVLIDLYDCPPSFAEERRDKSRCVDIVNPSLNVLAGTQPGFLANLLPEEAWSMGYMSRNIMIYSSSGPTIDLFDLRAYEGPKRRELAQRLTSMTELVGKATFSVDYQDAMRRWQAEGLEPVPNHSKLLHYCGRRLMFALKLSLISAVSRSGKLLIETEDLIRARSWMVGAENMMPDVFRDMVQKSDTQIISDLHIYLWKAWSKDKKPLHEARVFNFLKARATSERIPRIIDVAVRSNILARSDIAGVPYYVPKPHSEHGME